MQKVNQQWTEQCRTNQSGFHQPSALASHETSTDWQEQPVGDEPAPSAWALHQHFAETSEAVDAEVDRCDN